MGSQENRCPQCKSTHPMKGEVLQGYEHEYQPEVIIFKCGICGWMEAQLNTMYSPMHNNQVFGAYSTYLTDIDADYVYVDGVPLSSTSYGP